MRLKVLRIITFVFLMIGAVNLLVAGGMYLFLGSKTSDYVETDATVVAFEDYVRNDETRTRTTIEYEVDGQLYEARLNEYSSSWQVGQQIDVKYNPDDPYEVTTGIAQKFILPIFAAVGAVLLLIGVGMLFFQRRQKKKIEEMKRGQVVWGTIVQTQRTASRVNEMIGQRVGVQIVDAMGSRVVWSDPIYVRYDINLGHSVPVYIQGDQAWVDTERIEFIGR